MRRAPLLLGLALLGAGAGCVPGDPGPEPIVDGDWMTAEVSIVALRESPAAAPAVDEDHARGWVEAAALPWRACAIDLIPADFRVADADDASGVPFHPSTYASLRTLRQSLADPRRITVIVTGDWDRTRASDFYADDSWAYGSPPTAQYQGVVAEPRVLSRPLLLAHEIGHMLNLLHVDDPTTDQVDDTNGGDGDNLMFHLVTDGRSGLTPGQCLRAREAL